MAKRKRKASGRAKSGRRRIGKIADKSTLALAAGVAGGAFVATFAASKLSSLDPKIKAAVLAAGGIFIAGQSNPIIKGIGLGVAGAGALALVSSFGLIPASVSGIGAPLINFTPRGINGFNSYPNFPQANTITGFNQYPNAPQMNTIGNMSLASAGIF